MAAAIVDIAAHLRNIFGLSVLLVLSMKDSIHDRHFRLASPFVMTFVVFKSVEILCPFTVLAFRIRSIATAVFPFVPAYFAIIWYTHDAAVLEWDILHKHFL
jgi:hypothetical protein